MANRSNEVDVKRHNKESVNGKKMNCDIPKSKEPFKETFIPSGHQE